MDMVVDALGDRDVTEAVEVIEKVLLFFVDRVERDDEDSSRFVINEVDIVGLVELVLILYSAERLDNPSRGWVPKDGLSRWCWWWLWCLLSGNR
jgi:hypothetical protein